MEGLVRIMDGGEKLAKKLLLTSSLVGGIYITGIVGIQYIANLVSPRIQSQSQLERLLGQEWDKFDTSRKYNISVKLVKEDTGRSRKLYNGDYEVKIGGDLANESTLRHELYHVFDGHCDDIHNVSPGLPRKFKYLFWYEPQATIYQVTGWKP